MFQQNFYNFLISHAGWNSSTFSNKEPSSEQGARTQQPCNKTPRYRLSSNRHWTIKFNETMPNKSAIALPCLHEFTVKSNPKTTCRKLETVAAETKPPNLNKKFFMLGQSMLTWSTLQKVIPSYHPTFTAFEANQSEIVPRLSLAFQKYEEVSMSSEFTESPGNSPATRQTKSRH